MRSGDWTTTVMLAVFAVCGMTLGLGCAGGLEGESGDEDGPGWECEECDGGGESDDEKSPGESDESGDDAEQEEASIDGPCAPRAASPNVEQMPELPEKVRRETCSLEMEWRGELQGERPAPGTRWETTESGYRKVEYDRQGEPSRETSFEVREGQVRRVEQMIHDRLYAAGSEDELWEVDEQGRLERYRHRVFYEDEASEPDQVRDVRQTFEQGRLVDRTVREKNGDTGEWSETNVEWIYEAGRLDEVRYRADGGTTARVEWTYEQGRPTEVTRYVDGIPTVAQTWRYREDGGLAGRRLQYNPRGLEGQAEEPLPDVPSLDDAAVSMLRPPANIYGIFRFRGGDRDALPRPDTERGCYRLPTSSGHGYPTDRRAYRLVWDAFETGERSFVASYDLAGFGTGNPEESWYGHGGALGRRPGGLEAQSEAALDVEIAYDQRGRMASETVQREAPEGPSVVYRRTRSFGPDGLTDDVLEVDRRGPEAEGEDLQEHRRTLTLDRDEAGRLETRTLRVDGTAVSRQEFGYDDRGRWTRLEAYSRPDTLTEPTRWSRDVSRPVDVSPETSFEQTATYRRAYDAQGRRRLHHWEVPGAGYRRSHRRETEWGPHGPTVVETSRPARDDERLTRRRFRYDDQGRKVRLTVDEEGDDSPEQVERWKWRSERLEAHVVEDRDRGTRKTRSYRYACGEAR